MILEGWTVVVPMYLWSSKPKQMRPQKLTKSVLVQWGWDQWRGCERERSKVVWGRGRGSEGRRLREVRRRRGALEKIRAKKGGSKLAQFFFIIWSWHVALSAICQLLNMKKKNSLHRIIFQRASFQRGGYLWAYIHYQSILVLLTLLADKIFVLLYIKLIKY